MSDTSENVDMENTEDDAMELEEEEVQTEIVQIDLDPQEIEVESDLVNDPEEILPDISDARTPVPPLRPLSIAPKPAKMPFSFKSAGHQVFVVQGNATGQPLKLVSSLSQGLTLGNFQSGKTIALRTVPKAVPATNLSVLHPKQVVMKKVIQPSKTVATTEPKTVLLKESPDQQINSNRNNLVVSSPQQKTITLAQAQQLGILPSTKLISQVGNKQTVMLNKSQSKQVKGSLQTKQPPKILPAPEPSSKMERFILKPANTSSPNIMAPGQIIQVSGSQQIIAGQLHQINIPGKGIQYIKIVPSSTSTPGTASLSATATSSTNSKKVVIMPTGDTKLPLLTPVNNVTANKLNNIVLSETPTNASLKSIKPNSAIRSTIATAPEQLILLPAPKVAIPQIKTVATSRTVSETALVDMNLDSNGMRPRKPCNCTKSQCLKLYCDCFANGEFCYLCNCTNCSNNLENEELRQRAIKSCLDRNPNAFRPKIGKAKDTGDAAIRKHTKGCNCKRSGCLKNYCECYEAKIACSNNCKCVGCRNIEDMMEKKMAIAHNSHTQLTSSPPLLSKMGNTIPSQIRQRRLSNKFAFSFITDEVIEATSQCLLTISENADHTQDEETLKHQIIQEFGRCLMEIIECSSNRVVSTIN